MKKLSEQLSEIKNSFETALASISSRSDFETIKSIYVGKQGRITLLFAELKNFSLEEKKIAGPLLNELKKEVEEKLKIKYDELILQKAQATSHDKNFDVTAYLPNKPYGHLHPYTHLIKEVETIFMSMGYDVVDGPEVDSDYYNFTALNIPENHPARDMYDTFWLDVPSFLLRTHTSSVQARTIREKQLPIAAIVPGRCYRHEATDATHDFMFMQCEGILIDKNITLANLLATVQHFLRALFKKESIQIRTRPGFFPFVEPGLEIDMQCPFCTNGCSVCKKTRWIEVFPAGLIHPNVLREAGIDPNEYSGFAFGFGLTRLAMIRYKINDIRLFHSGKVRFLEQF